jgi:methionyl-tRNA formyltransferase
MQPRSSRPIRVVLFCGRFLEPAARRFLIRLAEHTEIMLLGAFAQDGGSPRHGRLRDLWRRRGMVAAFILVREAVSNVARFITGSPARDAEEQEATNGIVVVPDLHATEVREQVRALAPDLGLIYGSPILRPELFEIPRLGTLGIHHGRLPEYRGKKTTFWQLYQAEDAAGVTIQRVNAGIDTGDIVLEGRVSTLGKSYRRVAAEVQALGIELYLEAILRMREGTAEFRRPSGPKGPLYQDPTILQILALPLRRLRRRRPA